MRSVLRGLGSLIALIAALVGLPWALWEFGRQWLPDRVPTITEIGDALTRPDNGSLFLGAMVVVGFVAWACFAVGFVLELPAQLGWRRRPVRLPRGMRWSQQVAGALLAAVLSMSIAQVTATAAPAAAQMAVTAPVAGPAYTAPVSSPVAATPERPPPAPDAPATYVVVRGDTLWDIAERLLGDGARYPEIVNLNLGVLQPDGEALQAAGDINAGWVLALPAGAVAPAATADQVVVVQPGDTLSGIAAEQGLPGWRPIFDLNAGEVQPGGGLFTDPDLIIPGQALDMPVDPAPAPPVVVDEPAPAPVPDTTEPAPAPPPVEEPIPDGQPQPQAQVPDTDQEAAPDAADSTIDAGSTSPDLATVLAGGGALLAAGVGAAFLVHRRRRYFRRRPGRSLAATPAELVPAESAVLAGADEGRGDFAALDLALRSLSAALAQDPRAQLPDVVAAQLDGDQLSLRLHAPSEADPPAPWSADETGLWWSVDLTADLLVPPARAHARLAPYPALVSVGHSGAHRWLLDLERVGVLRLSGSRQRCEDFGRHLAAELAVNRWSDLNYVTMAGFGAELVDLHPARLTSVDDAAAAARELQARLRENLEVSTGRGVDVLDGRLRAIAGDSWMPEILVIAPQAPSQDVAELSAAVASHAGRGAVAVVASAGSSGRGWLASLTDDGQLLIPDLNLTLQAAQLSAEHGADIAKLVAFERSAEDVPMPAAAGIAAWQSYTDTAGALLTDLTLPREPRPYETPSAADRAWAPAVPGSVLPQATSVYVDASAASVEDVNALAPRTPPELSDRIEDDLEQLDQDLADWSDEGSKRPKLTLLGRVSVTAHGDRKALAEGHRRLYEEVIAYLATRANGATADELAAALRPDVDEPTMARQYVYRACTGARKWLGKDPDTDEHHLRAARTEPYSVSDKLLVDVDLFCQLRARAQARGAEGIHDLRAALDLVSGPPFSDQRREGYAWLGPLAHHYTGMIGDVAHLVVISALPEGDIAAARAALESALRAAPDDVKVLIDAVWVAFQDGNAAEGEALVGQIVRLSDVDVDVDLDPKLFAAIERARHLLDRAS